LTRNLGFAYTVQSGRFTAKAKKEGKNEPETPNFQERMAKVVQVLDKLN
jgi:hypothetical protein